MDQPTRAVEDYLKAIHSLGGDDSVVSPVSLAEHLQVRAASVTGMLRRLANAGWIVYRVGHGAKLSRKGTAEARRIIRRHRLMELFLTQVLGLDWSEVDREAEALEHAISARLEQAIAEYLGEPLEDPHGHLIPTREGKLTRRMLRPLQSFRPGECAVIREVQDDRPERLRRWSELGLRPGARVTMVGHEPLDGTFQIQVDERLAVLGAEALIGLLAEPARSTANGKSSAAKKPSRKPGAK
jgi:DtxR family Mn-dependent transcriptional regulator